MRAIPDFFRPLLFRYFSGYPVKKGLKNHCKSISYCHKTVTSTVVGRLSPEILSTGGKDGKNGEKMAIRPEAGTSRDEAPDRSSIGQHHLTPDKLIYLKELEQRIRVGKGTGCAGPKSRKAAVWPPCNR
jgi:hypothetical protein